MTKDPAKTIDLAFLRDRKAQMRMAAVTLLFAAVGGLYGVLAPRWYRSELVVVPGKSQRAGGLSSLLGGDLGALAGSLDTAQGADGARIAAVLKSNAVTDAVIEKLNLKTRYSETYQELARAALWQHCAVRNLPKPNLVELSCEDQDPRFVQEMLRYFAEYGNDAFRRVNVGSASEEARFLERRVADLRQQADLTAARMREFQEKNQIVDLESQARAVVSSLAMLHGQRISKRMELGYARSFSSAEEAGARQLESQISVVDDMLRDLEEPSAPQAQASQKRPGRSDAGVFPSALAVPKLRSEYEKLYRDRKVAEATLLFALDRLEGAKASEARDVSTFQVLDPPTVPTRKSRPKGSETTVRGALFGLIGAMAFEWWRSRKRPAG
jgi:uncharacterized protein involved in exopolysaccharide biosynthesis